MRTDDYFNTILEEGDHVYDGKNGELVSVSYDSVLMSEIELARRKKQKYFSDKIRNPAFDSYGTFYWLCFTPIEEIFPELNGTEITMLIMLSTFIDYSNLLLTSNNKRMRQSDLPRILKTSKSTVSRFVNHLKNVGILTIVDNGDMYLNTLNVYRGEQRQRITKTTRIYNDTCRKLYYLCDTKQRSKLSFVFRMIPWINYKNNMLSCTPFDDEEDNLMSLGDFAEIIGYGRNNASTLWKCISSIRIGNEPIALAVLPDSDFNNATIIVNPKLFCGCRDVEYIRELFSIMKKKAKRNKRRI